MSEAVLPGVRVARAGPRPRANWVERLGSRLLTANAVALFIFLYLPILVLVIFSFNRATTIGTGRVIGGSVWNGFTFDWYRQLLSNSRIIDSLKNTIVVALTSTALSTVLGTTVALALDRYRFKGRTVLDAVLYLPIIIPDIVMALSLILFFVLIHLNQTAFDLAKTVGDVAWLPAGLAAIIERGIKVIPIIIAHVAFNISFVAVVVRARLADFDRTLEEAAKDLYANEWQTFRRVTLPLIMPGILGGALLAFTLSIDDFVITFFVSGPGATTLPVQVFSMIRIGVTPEVNALSSAMLIVSVVMVMLSLVSQRR